MLALAALIGGVLLFSQPRRPTVTPHEDVLMQNPTIIPTQIIPGMSSQNPEVAAGIEKYQQQLTSGTLRDSSGRIAGGQFW
jgi:hypothetical protein